MIIINFAYFCFSHMWLTAISFSETSSHNEDDDNFANEQNEGKEITSPFMKQQGPQTKELPRHRLVKYTQTPQ